MGCRSDYLEANGNEVNLSVVKTFLEELETGVYVKKNADGYRKDVYNKDITKEEIDNEVSNLCSKLQLVEDVMKYSLELQMWWRDHQIADKLRVEKELKEISDKELREQAMSKLSDYEKKLLGV